MYVFFVFDASFLGKRPRGSPRAPRTRSSTTRSEESQGRDVRGGGDYDGNLLAFFARLSARLSGARGPGWSRGHPRTRGRCFLHRCRASPGTRGPRAPSGTIPGLKYSRFRSRPRHYKTSEPFRGNTSQPLIPALGLPPGDPLDTPPRSPGPP